MNIFNTGIAWGRVGAIALVQGAITLLWLVYRLYLGDLLAGWGFSEDFTAQLLIVETILALVMEPIFGSLSDRQKQQFGSRGPLIVFGVILTAAISIGFPLFAVLNLNMGRLLLPSLAIVWALAMTMFRAPVYALLSISASRQGLPLAMGFLMMTGGFTNLLKDPLKPVLLGLGAIPCFIIASITLLASATCLRFFLPPQPLTEQVSSQQEPFPWLTMGKIMFIAVALIWGGKILTGNLTRLFSEKMFTLNLLLALAALPIGWCAKKWHRYPLFPMAIASLALLLTVLITLPTIGEAYIVIGLWWIVAFAVLQNGTLSYVITVTSERWTGLGIGIYFGFVGIANTFFPQLFPSSNSSLNTIIGFCALVLAVIVVLMPTERKPLTLEKKH